MNADYIISGGLGFIGKNLSIKLSRSFKDFVILDKLTGCDLCKMSIRMDSCNNFIHLASFTDVRKSLLNPKQAIIQNCSSTIRGLDYARDCEAHFVFTSSMGAPDAMSPYSASKFACEAICNAYRESYKVNTTVLRLSNVYGPHSLHKTSVIAAFIRNALDKKALTIFGDGEQTRAFVYVDDVVNALLTCNGNKLLNISSGKSISIKRLAYYIQEISQELTSYSPPVKFNGYIAGEIFKVNSETDIRPKTTLKQGLKKTFKWFMENYDYGKN